MTTTRRNFLKKARISGICLCGFSTILGSETFTPKTPSSETPNKNEIMFLKWITELLENLENSHLTEAQLRQIIKSSSIAHHHNLEMDTMLTPFKGHLDNFIEFIEEKWGWKVSYEDSNKQVLIVDEDKPFCVCPLLQKEKEKKFPALCYCSEGFAERMFTIVCNHPVNATVISSIQRGNNKCIYRIVLNP